MPIGLAAPVLPQGLHSYAGDQAPSHFAHKRYGEPDQAWTYDRDRFFVLTARGCQVIDFPARMFRDAATLVTLAPLEFWLKHFPGSRGIDTNTVADSLVTAGYNAGVFNTMKIRGRGAWWDGDRVVLHLGNRLLVDGRACGLTEIESRYIYEAGPSLPYRVTEPLSDGEAEALLEVCDMLRLEQSLSGELLAGCSIDGGGLRPV